MARIVGVLLILSMVVAGCASASTEDDGVVSGSPAVVEEVDGTTTTSIATTSMTVDEVPDSVAFSGQEADWTEEQLRKAIVRDNQLRNELWTFSEPETVPDAWLDIFDSEPTECSVLNEADQLDVADAIVVDAAGQYGSNPPWEGLQTMTALDTAENAIALADYVSELVVCRFESFENGSELDPSEADDLTGWRQIDVEQLEIEGANAAIMVDFASPGTGRIRIGIAVIGSVLVTSVFNASGFYGPLLVQEAQFGRYPDHEEWSSAATEAFGFEAPDHIDDIVPNMEEFFEAAVNNIQTHSTR